MSVRGAVESLLQEREQRKRNGRARRGLGPGGPQTDERRREGDQNGPPCSASNVAKNGFQVNPNLDLTIAMLLCILLEEKHRVVLQGFGDHTFWSLMTTGMAAVSLIFIRTQRSMSGLC